MRYRRRRRIQTDPTPSATGQMMNLSLFIMLLAFFIVLNAISSFQEDKASKVRRSVERAFTVQVMEDNERSSVTEGKAQSVNEGNSFDRLEALFQSQLSGFDSTKDLSRGIMMVEVDYTRFKEAINVLNQQDLTQTPTRDETRGNFFLPTLSSIMQANINGAPTRMEIYLHVNQNPGILQNEQPRDVRIKTNILGEFSRKLENQGVPEKLVNIGMIQGDPQKIKLVFRKYTPFSPVVMEAKER